MNKRFPAFIETFKRRDKVVQFLLRRLLRAHPHEFETYGRMTAIVGDVISDQIRAQGRYDDVNLRAIAALLLPHIECGKQYCLDVGANIGNHALFFSPFFERVVAFEPNPLARSLLEINLQINGATNVDIKPVGLSDRMGSATLSVCQYNLGASRLRHLAEADSEFAESIVDEVQIDLVPGDSVVDPEASIGLIKIDVEGLERQVLLGLAQTIARHRPMIVMEELASAIGAKTGRSPATDFLIDLGYRTFEIKQIFRSRFNLVNGLMAYLAGNVRHVLVPVKQLENHNYAALLFLTDEIAARIGGCE